MLPVPEVSPYEEPENWEAGADSCWLPVEFEPVAFLRMLERLRLPASLAGLLPGLKLLASYETSGCLTDDACEKPVEPMWADEPLARAARKDAAGCAAFSKIDGSDGRLLDSRTLPDPTAAATLTGS